MVKGSGMVRDSHSRAVLQVERALVVSVSVLEDSLSSRQTKDMRCVVFCMSKAYEATGRTRLGRLKCGVTATLDMVYQTLVKTQSCVRCNVKVT